MKATLSATTEERKKITPNDITFKDIINIEKPNQLNDVRPKDIVEYADKEASRLCASIIENKIEELRGQGKDIKNTLIAEGLSDKKYHTYLKRMNSRLKSSMK